MITGGKEGGKEFDWVCEERRYVYLHYSMSIKKKKKKG